MNSIYRGRFAPTPSGPAHLGTLLAALASFLQARAMQGKWYVRIDDIDPPREVAGAADSILHTLERFGLHWDGAVVYQSRRQEAYRQALETLTAQGDTYECSCSRKDIRLRARHGPNGMIYPGSCRSGVGDPDKPRAIRITTGDEDIVVTDRIQGVYRLNMQLEVGDFIVRRADGLIAYHLATVVDDALDGFTEIVRGKDQLGLTPLHIHLQNRLDQATPAYAHLPLLTNAGGDKLGKSSRATPVDELPDQKVWQILLSALGIEAPQGLLQEQPENILQWAIQQWDLDRVPQQNILV